MNHESTKLKHALDSGHFPVTVELVPGRGSREKWFDKLMDFVGEAEQDSRITAISITDHPSGIGSMSPVAVAVQFLGLSHLEPMVHISAKDLSRNGVEGYLYALDRIGVRNVLLLTGDYPTTGYQGISKPVFDLDSVWMTRMVSEMNAGLPDRKSKKTGEWMRLGATHFYKGVAVSPFKNTEEELILQYWKLNKKIQSGADFVIPQLGYDMRKFEELLRIVRSSEEHIPLLGNVYVPTFGAAKALHRNSVPGAYLSEALLKQMEEESHAEDKGRAVQISRAAMMIAVLRGMGYDGVHLGGHGLVYREVVQILDEADAWASRWQELITNVHYPDPNAYYLFTEDKETLLNTDTLVKPSVQKRWSFNYASMAFGHALLFKQDGLAYRFARLISKRVNPKGSLAKGIEFLERLTKSACNHCKECGDCALPNMAFLCPVSQCPKNQRVGPCGGSRDGWCEVYPDERLCVWVRAYRNLGAQEAEKQFADQVIPPRNHALDQRSSWLNYYAERDNAAHYGVPPQDRAPSLFEPTSLSDTEQPAEPSEPPTAPPDSAL